MKKLSKIEIIKETVDFYSEDTSRRSITPTGCMYNSKNGRHCAFGRCMLPKYQEQGESLPFNSYAIYEFIKYQKDSLSIDDVLQEKYRGHNMEFWRQIQRFHDVPGHWDANGLTELGIKYKNKLINIYTKHNEKIN